MIINHYCNSFLSVDVNNRKLVCDPWIGHTNESAWYSYPFLKSPSYLNKIDPEFIYISHLHCDHFDPKTLKKFKNKKVKIIIKNFKNKRLKNKIYELGFNNIIEINEWEKTKISNEFNIAIIPQMSSNTSDLDDKVNYDLDTSIVIQSRLNKKIFYNNVDNPLTIKNLKKLNTFIKKNFSSSLSAFCYPLGAASGYPQTFINLNKEKEKNRIIKESLKKVEDIINIFKPEIYFPAGGTYLISGKFHRLNKWIAQPNRTQIIRHFKDKKFTVAIIEGGGCIELSKTNRINDTFNKTLKNTNLEVELKLANKTYFYQKNMLNKSSKVIENLFSKCQENYYKRNSNMMIEGKWNIKINLFNHLFLKKNGAICNKKSNFTKSFIIKGNKKFNSKSISLTCYLDQQLFYNLMSRGSPWNTALTGSIILFYRKSKIYNPTLENSLNFFTI